jgi:hypothetical protein
MNIDILHEGIKTFNDFDLTLNHIIKITGLLCFKKSKDANSLNSSDKSLLEYYKREKNKIIDSINIYAKVYKIDFKEGSVVFCNEYDNMLEEVKEIYFNSKERNYTIKENITKDLTTYFKEVENSIWIAFYNYKIKELKGGLKKDTPFYDPVFENAQSRLFFEFLIKEWFNTLPKPKSAISFVFYLMFYNDNDLPITLRGLKYIIKNIRQLDFAHYWNENYKEIHKHKYEIPINGKTARLKTFSEIPTDKYINELNKFVEKFEHKK